VGDVVGDRVSDVCRRVVVKKSTRAVHGGIPFPRRAAIAYG
jgi:hypothetical protein